MAFRIGLEIGLALAASACTPLVGSRGAEPVPPRAQREAEAPQAQPAADTDLHPVILAYRESLRPFLTEHEAAALDAIDWRFTARGDTQRLRYLAADRAIRRMLPIVLEAQGSAALDAHATRLRALPPLLNRDTDLVARGAVREAMAALRHAARGTAPAPPRPIAATPSAEGEETGAALARRDPSAEALTQAMHELRDERPARDPEAEILWAEALADYAVEYGRSRGVSALQAAAAAAAVADAIDVAFFVGSAVQRTPARERIVEEALRLAADLCNAARRGERLPRLHEAQRAPARDAR